MVMHRGHRGLIITCLILVLMTLSSHHAALWSHCLLLVGVKACFVSFGQSPLSYIDIQPTFELLPSTGICFGSFSSCVNDFHFSITLTVKKFLIKSSFVLGTSIWWISHAPCNHSLPDFELFDQCLQCTSDQWPVHQISALFYTFLVGIASLYALVVCQHLFPLSPYIIIIINGLFSIFSRCIVTIQGKQTPWCAGAHSECKPF